MSQDYKPEDYKGPTEFVHLHNHTVFSALDGVATPEQYASQCAKRGYPAMSATEHGHMASVPDMYLAFKRQGVQYIPGCEVYYNDWEPKRQKLVENEIKYRSNDWKAAHPMEYYRIARNRHLTLLCKNEVGFNNLIKLTTEAYRVGRYGMGRNQLNRIWFEQLAKYREGLICLSGCLNGPVAHELRFTQLSDRDREKVIYERPKRDGKRDAIKYVKKFKELFGDDYFIEVQMTGLNLNDGLKEVPDYKIFHDLLSIADHFDIKPVVTNDCHYLNRKDFMLQKVMMAVAQDTTVDSPDLFHVNSDEQYMKSRGELWSFFKNGGYSNGVPDSDFEALCDNSLLIADICEPFVVDTSPKIPEIDDADAALKKAVAKSLTKMNLNTCNRKFLIDGREVTYVQQAKIELNRFIDKGFASYFLITQDLVGYGRAQGWPFSPRGSAGGSLVCYLLGIHVLDPMVWGLSFDRFLSPSRGGYMLNTKMGNPVTV